jgi:putative ABC transport system ATP-binding protein
MKPLIEVKNVRKVYRMGEEKVVALDDISLSIQKGEIICLIGASGSGKSTFLNLVAGLEKPSRGEIYIGGVPIHKLNEEKVTLFRQKNIGFIFQSFHLLAMLTALENVSLPLIFRGEDRKKRDKLAKDMLEAVGLVGFEKRTPSRMSGGQQQRVGIARALVGHPKIIFADEPTGNLDSATSKEVMSLIVKMVRENNQTLLIVTHDPAIAAYADRVVTIMDGNILNIEVRNAGTREEPVQQEPDINESNIEKGKDLQ